MRPYFNATRTQAAPGTQPKSSLRFPAQGGLHPKNKAFAANSPFHLVPTEQLQPFQFIGSQGQSSEKQGVLASLKTWLADLIFEPEEGDRPIGISQLSRRTFVPNEPQRPDVFYRSPGMAQDFRFSKLRERTPYGTA